MSGRPVQPPAPSHTVRTWATDTDYPAGSDDWSGQPTKVEPASAVEGFVPNQGAAAEEFNKLFSDAFTTDQAAKDFLTANATNLDAWASYLGQSPAFNWKLPTTILAGQLYSRFGTFNRFWYAGGQDISGISQFVSTPDPDTWPGSNEIGGGATIVSDGNFDVDGAGHIVMPGTGGTDGNKVTEFGSAWTKHTTFTNPLVHPDVAYAPTAALWCVAGKRNGADLLDVWTSPDRVNWTARTAPAMPIQAGLGPLVSLGSDGAGTLVMQASDTSIPSDTGSKMSFSRSLDGGITWSTPDQHTDTMSGSVSGPMPKPLWTGSRWIAIACSNAGITYVYSSADGLAFTKIATLTSVKFTGGVAAIGELLLGMSNAGALAFSIDGGVTWQWTDRKLVSGANLGGGGPVGRFVILDGAGGNIYVSAASSAGVKTVT